MGLGEDERRREKLALSCGGNVKAFVGALTVVSLADVGLDVITPYASAASCL